MTDHALRWMARWNHARLEPAAAPPAAAPPAVAPPRVPAACESQIVSSGEADASARRAVASERPSASDATGAVLIALLTAFYYWGRQPKQRSTGLQFLAYPGVDARSRGSLPCWGRSASDGARACRPIPRACRTGWGTSLWGNRTLEPNVISTIALASRPKLRIKIAREGLG